MRTSWIWSIFVAGGLAAAAPPKPPVKHVAKLSIESARKIALVRVHGKVRAEELEHEHGRWVYSFEIKATGETKQVIQEVNIDADTGEIVGVETERE